MIRLLLADDTERRTAELERALLKELGTARFSLLRAGSYQEALDLLGRAWFDLIIVDLHLPILTGSSPDSRGGAQLLDYLIVEKVRRVPEHIIGITAFREIGEQFANQFREAGRLLLDAPVESVEWAESVAATAGRISANQNVTPPPRCKAVVLCSQYEEEFEQLCKASAVAFGCHSNKVDRTQWHLLTPPDGPTGDAVYAGWAPEMGMTAMAGLTMEALFDLAPRYVVLCGIAAACSSDVSLGDVIVGDLVWDAEAGKIITGDDGHPEVQFSPAQLRMAPSLLQDVREAARDKAVLSELLPAADGTQARIHIGPIASVHRVIAHGPFARGLKLQQRRVLGLEMEGYGVFRAATMARSTCAALPMIIKGASDKADDEKGDRDRQRASYNSALFTLSVLQRLK